MSYPGGGDRGPSRSIEAGAYRATVCAVGATLDSLTHGGRDLVLPNPPRGPMLLHRGAIIAPWPNRIGDGRYTWEGQELQVPITEPERGNALHGLLSFQPYEELDASASVSEWGSILYPTPGYPFLLQVHVRYSLDADTGLTTALTVLNAGDRAAPLGACPHPYLVAGEGRVDDWTLEVEAEEVLEVDERLLPTGHASITPGSELDFRGGAPLAGRALDHALTGLGRDPEGVCRVRVRDGRGAGTQIAFGPELPWLQVHTADRPEPEWNRAGLAVEPMSCPPDAFRSGTDLIRLEPGESTTLSWSISAL